MKVLLGIILGIALGVPVISIAQQQLGGAVPIFSYDEMEKRGFSETATDIANLFQARWDSLDQVEYDVPMLTFGTETANIEEALAFIGKEMREDKVYPTPIYPYGVSSATAEKAFDIIGQKLGEVKTYDTPIYPYGKASMTVEESLAFIGGELHADKIIDLPLLELGISSGTAEQGFAAVGSRLADADCTGLDPAAWAGKIPSDCNEAIARLAAAIAGAIPEL